LRETCVFYGVALGVDLGLPAELVAGARDRAFGNGDRVLKEARRQARFFFLRVEVFFFNVFFLVLFKI
jgi:hypothetical protein